MKNPKPALNWGIYNRNGNLVLVTARRRDTEGNIEPGDYIRRVIVTPVEGRNK